MPNPFDFSGLPNKATPGDFDMSGLPDKSNESRDTQSTPGFLERLGGWRGVGATGVRALSGILSAGGGPVGALTSGAGEAGAQLLEGPKVEPPTGPPVEESPGRARLRGFLSGAMEPAARIATEAGFGAVPFGKVVKGGKLIESAVKSGAMGGAHAAVSQGVSRLASGEMPDTSDLTPVATGGALGALFGGIGSRFGVPKVAKVAAPTQTAAPVITQEAGNKVFRVPPPTKPALAAVPTPQATSAYQENVRGGLSKLLGKAPDASAGLEDLDAGIQGARREASATRAGNFRSDVAAQRGETNADVASIKAQLAQEARDAKQAMKEAADQAAEDRIQQTIEDRGLVPGKPSVSLSTSAPTEEGRLSQRIPYKKPKPPGEANIVDILGEDTTPTVTKTTGTPTPRPTVSPDWEPLYGPAAKVATPEAPTTPLERLLSPAKLKPTKGEKFDTKAQGIADQYGPPSEPRVESPVTSEPTAPLEAPPQAPGATNAPSVGERPTAWDQYPPEVVQELDKLGAQYRGPVAEKGTSGKELAEIRDFMSGKKMRESWRGAPEAEVTPQVEPPAPVRATAEAPLIDEGGYQPSTETTSPHVHEMTPEEIQGQYDFISRMKKLGGSESGSVNPALTKLGTTAGGAAIGAPVGASYDEEDPAYGALKGALLGGAIGSQVPSGANALINARNAGLLLGPAQLKKPLSDVGTYIGETLERAGSRNPADRAMARRLAVEAFRVPTNARNYMAGLKNPDIAKIGELVDLPRTKGPLGWVARPFAAAQHATQQAMQRAGVPEAEAVDALFMADPKIAALKSWLDLQKHPAWRAVRPFARIATNIFEKGLERTPGLSYKYGDPNTAAVRSLAGLGAGGLGYGTGAMDQAAAEEGTPTSGLTKGLRRAAMARYGLPFVIGEALGGDSPREIYNMIPGISQAVPPPAPSDTTGTAIEKLAKRYLDQQIPGFLKPDTGSAR